jgi:ribosomal protein L29
MALNSKELRGMSVAELKDKERVLRVELTRMQMQRHARRLDKTSDLKAKKRELARLLTIAAQKQLAAAGGSD